MAFPRQASHLLSWPREGSSIDRLRSRALQGRAQEHRLDRYTHLLHRLPSQRSVGDRLIHYASPGRAQKHRPHRAGESRVLVSILTSSRSCCKEPIDRLQVMLSVISSVCLLSRRCSTATRSVAIVACRIHRWSVTARHCETATDVRRPFNAWDVDSSIAMSKA